MKKALVTLLFSVISLCVSAQISEATAIAKRAAKPFTTNTSFIAKFSAKVATGRTDGVIYVNGDKYRIETDEIELIFDGKQRYNYMKKNKEIYIENPNTTDGDVMQSPQRLLKLTENSEPTLKKKTDGNTTLYFEKEGLIVNIGSNDDIKSVEVISDKNNKVTIDILSVDTKAVINDSMFSFDKSKYSGVEIIDFR